MILFETLLAENGCATFVEAHLTRLARSARRLAVPCRTAQIRRALHRSLSGTAGVRRVRLTLHPDGHFDISSRKIARHRTRLGPLVACRLAVHPARTAYPRGTRGLKTEPRVWLERIHSRWAKAGFDDAVLLDRRRRAYELTRANLFWIADGIIYTPPLSSGCLPGVIRAATIKLAGRLGTTIRERSPLADELLTADGIFRTSAVIGMQWAREIRAGRKLARWPRPHPIIRKIAAAFRRLK